MRITPTLPRRWRAGSLLAAGLLLVQAGPPRLAAVAGTAPPAAVVAVRSGDEAPVARPRLPRSFGCRLAAEGGGATPALADRPFLSVDGGGTALYVTLGSATRVVAYAGRETPGGGRLAALCEASMGHGGVVAFHAFLADGREGIYRTDLFGTSLDEILLTGSTLELRDGPQTLGVLSGPSVDAAGEVFVEVDFFEGAGALLRLAPGAAPEVLLQSGDALAGERFLRAPTAPAANASGTVAFTAMLDSGREVVATLAPGGSPAVIFQGTAAPGQPPPTVSIAPPALNDAGQVAFLWAVGGAVRVQRVAGSLSTIVAATGSAAPGGGTFREITDLEPSIDPSGRVLFGAVRSNGRAGIYLTAAPTAAVAEEGMALADAGTLTRVAARQAQGAPAFLPDGSVLFAAQGTVAGGLFTWTAGTRAIALRSGEPFTGPARFSTFMEPSIPFMGGGPALSAAGTMIFDARVTGGERGLFVRDRDGRLEVVASGADPAPGGGHFDGASFSFHAIDARGVVAFLAAAPDGPAGPGLALYYGAPPGAVAPGLPPLCRVIGVGDPAPESLTGGSGGLTVADLQAPSRLSRGGAIVLPVILSDGETLLLAYDGTVLGRLIGPGDPAPFDATFIQVFTGSYFLGVPVQPALSDAGRVVFGGMTSGGDFALFATRLDRAALEAPERVAGAGDEAGGGRLSPFEVQSLDQDDASGRVAFSSAYDEDYDFGVFMKDASGLRAVARRFDPIGDLGFVNTVMPRLALAGGGRTAYGARFLSGREAILLQGAAAGGEGDPAPDVETLAITGGDAPDGGLYVAFQALTAGGFRSRPTGRLASDGTGRLAWAAATGAGPEEIVLFGSPPNMPPVADAGRAQTVECAGPDGARVGLDGGASYDPDGDPITYRWSGPFGTAEGVSPTVGLPLGVSTITLVVNDGQDDSAPATVTIEVRDTVPPLVVASASPALLWPPDGRMVPTSFGVSATDLCDPSPSVTLVGISTFDPGGSGRRGPDYLGADLGSDDRSIDLRAERGGGGPGRTYAVTYRAADRSGNGAFAAATVTVPHDQRR